MMKTLVFDVDGTLVLTGGAGMGAMTLAFAELFGIENGFEGVPMGGRIDAAILRAALAKRGLGTEGFEDTAARFQESYVRHLTVTLREAKSGHVLPGIREMLDALKPREDVRLGLATGNWRRGAELKLSHYGLWDLFVDGGFGEDCEERSELVAKAIQRLTDGLPEQGAVYVIGDTVYDIEAAKANGAVAVAVGSGFTTVEDLRAARPDFLFADFSDWQAALRDLGI